MQSSGFSGSRSSDASPFSESMSSSGENSSDSDSLSYSFASESESASASYSSSSLQISSSYVPPPPVPIFCGCDSMPGTIGITFAAIACAPSISGQSFTLTYNGSIFTYSGGGVIITITSSCEVSVISDNCNFPMSALLIVCIPVYSGGMGNVSTDLIVAPGCACAPGASVDFTLY
jgi:hypothetical protein